MSNYVYSMCKRKSVGSIARKSVLLCMADFASDDGSGIWASKPNMAADLEMSESTLRDAISFLVSQGVVGEVGRRNHRNGYTVEYCINLEVVERLESTRKEPLRQPDPSGSRTPTPPAAVPLPLRQPDPNLNITILEPSEVNIGEVEVSKPKPSRSVRLPDNWVPSVKNISDAQKKGFSHAEIGELSEQFRDHHLARGTAFKDWDAGWRTWVNKARKFAKPTRNTGASRATANLRAGFQASAADDRRGDGSGPGCGELPF